MRDVFLMSSAQGGDQYGTAALLPHLQNRATLAVISLEVLGLCSKELQSLITNSVLTNLQAAGAVRGERERMQQHQECTAFSHFWSSASSWSLLVVSAATAMDVATVVRPYMMDSGTSVMSTCNGPQSHIHRISYDCTAPVARVFCVRLSECVK